MEEIWKDIKGYEGRYQVSNLGRVKSLPRRGTICGERLLVSHKTADGYLLVNLCKDGKGKNYRVHRLVAEAFIPNPYGLPQVNHLNEDKKSNVVTNLEWCDAAYNSNYGTRTERSAKAQSKSVYQYTKDGSLVRSYSSTQEVKWMTGYDNGHISACCNGKRKQAYGFIWSYNLL